MSDLQTSSIAPLNLIVGLGETGVAAVRWCLRKNEQVRVADTRDDPAGLNALTDDERQSIQFCLGGEVFNENLLDGVSKLVLSPGLSPLESPVKALLDMAQTRAIPVLGEIELFALALEQLKVERGYEPKVLGITGTNGKTTVTALTCQMLQAAEITACAAGNISPAALDALMKALDQEALPQVWVLELSSFQLETTHRLNFTAAVVLNISQDHLDWAWIDAGLRRFQSKNL